MNDLAFAEKEFEDRLVRIRRKMQDAGLNALILTRPENIFYTSGFRAAHIANRTSELHVVVIPSQGEPRLITRALEAETTKSQWTKSPRLFKDHEDPYTLLVAILDESGGKAGKIGIEERFLRLSQFKKMQKYLSGATFAEASGMVESVAAFPSKAESECMRNAARITDIGLQAGMRAIKDGVYPYEIIGQIHYAMYAAGQSDFDKSLVAVWSGPRGGRMHDTSTTERIKSGDLVTVEIMGVDNHYRVGAQACAFVGDKAPQHIADAYKMVADMHEKAKATVKAGRTAGEIFDAANSVYRAAKGVDYYRRCGGSMGLTQFTLDLVKGRQDVLTPGVSLLIQTLVDDPVLLTCASTVVVTEGGYDELTKPILSLTPSAP
jgi:Xaa-Pro dipeptidase